MTIPEFLMTFEGGSITLVVLLTLVQLSPIKIDPWTAIARGIGRAINAELLAKVDNLEERDIIATRMRILRFGDEILHGERHSKEHFDQILVDIDYYNAYCRAHENFQNNLTVLTSKRIQDVYQSLLKTNEFL